MRIGWPRSLSSQMAMMLAIALFVAQAINFAMLFEGRRQFRIQQAVGPAVTRLMDVDDQLVEDRQPARSGHHRVRVSPSNPIDHRNPRRPDVEQALRAALAESGIRVGRIDSEVRRLPHDDPGLRDMSHHRARRYRHFGGELVLAVEQPKRGWTIVSLPWAQNDWPLIAQLIGQTLILYFIVLLPVLWIVRRISRPLQSLAQAVTSFMPGEELRPIDERGPADVRAVTTAFNALAQRVSAMLDEKDRMLGAIGHDLRTPLAALRVRIESVEDDDDRARMADTIDEMNRTLDDILSLARLGRPSEAATEVDLAALVDAVVEDFVAIGSPVTLADSDRLTLRLRPSLMRRAIRNLIENAVKYGGSAAVRIEQTAERVAIIVADTGPGIPTNRMNDVFDAFTRLETSRNRDTGGAGLGLALARAIVREAGGDITLANRAEGGLEASIVLPRR